MRRPVVLALAAVVVTAVLVAGGLALLGGHAGRSGTQSGTQSGRRLGHGLARLYLGLVGLVRDHPLAAYDTGDATVTRGAFCDRIDPRQVGAALGGAVTSQRSWSDGDRTRLGGGPTDVSHEYGCEYVGDAGTTARAWVFAPPVRASAARRLAGRTDGAGTCTSTASTFGSPSASSACAAGQQRSATYRGLFGDAWLTCQLTGPVATAAAELADRTGRWCVGVLKAMTAAG